MQELKNSFFELAKNYEKFKEKKKFKKNFKNDMKKNNKYGALKDFTVLVIGVLLLKTF